MQCWLQSCAELFLLYYYSLSQLLCALESFDLNVLDPRQEKLVVVVAIAGPASDEHKPDSNPLTEKSAEKSAWRLQIRDERRLASCPLVERKEGQVCSYGVQEDLDMADEVEVVVVSVTEGADEEAEGVVELEVGAVEFAAAGLIADKLAVAGSDEADEIAVAVFEEAGKIAVGCNLAELVGRTDTQPLCLLLESESVLERRLDLDSDTEGLKR